MRANFVSKALVSSLVIFDTSIFIDQLRTGRHQERIQSVIGLVRTSAVVISELWRGASSRAEQNFLRALQKNHPVLVPTMKNWLDLGQILSKIRTDKGFLPEKLRDLHLDVLIALTALS